MSIFKNGRRDDGIWKLYSKAGKLKSKGYYRNGKKDGPWEYYDNDGDIERQINFRNGIEVY